MATVVSFMGLERDVCIGFAQIIMLILVIDLINKPVQILNYLRKVNLL